MERCSKVWREHSPLPHHSSFRVLGHRNTQICVTHPSAQQTHRSRSLQNMWPSVMKPVLNFTTVYNQTVTQTISRLLIGSDSLTSLCSAAWLTSQPAAEIPTRSTRAVESVTTPTNNNLRCTTTKSPRLAAAGSRPGRLAGVVSKARSFEQLWPLAPLCCSFSSSAQTQRRLTLEAQTVFMSHLVTVC